MLYCFAINLLYKKLNNKLRWEQIKSIIKVININVNNDKEYINNIKKSHRIKETTKRYIEIKINSIIEYKIECNSIIKTSIWK